MLAAERRESRSGVLSFAVNSAFAFACAQLITVTLHEAGHAIAAKCFGFSPRIYAFYENNPVGSIQQSLIIDATGPIMSLVIGVVFYALYRKSVSQYNVSRLFVFWMAWLGIILFVNYLIIMPFLASGDTAHVANLLGLPMWLRYVVATLAALSLVPLARPAAASMFALNPGRALDSTQARRRYVFAGFLLPSLAGTALCAIAGIGGNLQNVLIGLLGTFAIVDVVVAVLFTSSVERRTWDTGRALPAKVAIQPIAIALYIALVGFFVFVLRPGLPI